MPRLSFHPGIYSDDPGLSVAGRYTSGTNIRFRDGRAETIDLHRQFSPTVLEGKARGICTARLHDTVLHTDFFTVVVGTNEHLYIGKNIGTGWIFDTVYDFELLSGGTVGPEYAALLPYGPLTVPTTWSIQTAGNAVFAVPSGRPILSLVKADNGVGAACYELIPSCAAAFVTEDFFAVYLGIIEAASTNLAYDSPDITNAWTPMTVVWSNQESYANFTVSDTTLAGFYTLRDGSRVVGGGSTTRGNLIWTDHALYIMRPLYDGEFVFGFDKIGSGCGLAGAKAWCEADGRVWWLSPQGAYFFYDGGSARQVACTVSAEAIFPLDWLQTALVHAQADTLFTEVSWSIPRGRNGNELDGEVVYNYQTGDWSLRSVTRTCTADQNGVISRLGVGANGIIYEHGLRAIDPDVLPIDWELITAPFDRQPAVGDFAYEKMFSCQRLVMDRLTHVPLNGEASFEVTMAARDWPEPGDQFARLQRQIMHPNTRELPFHVEGRQMRMELRGTGTAQHRFGDMMAWFKPGGER